MPCDSTPRVVDEGVTFGESQRDAVDTARSAADSSEPKHMCPAPCESWFRLNEHTGRMTQKDLRAYRQLMGIPEDVEMLRPPRYKCVWELVRKCLNPASRSPADTNPKSGDEPF